MFCFQLTSKIQQDRSKLKNAYLKVLEYVSFIAILANLCLFAVSEEFLYFILGQGTDKWLPALSAFRILCVYGIVRSLLEPVGNVIMALGMPNILIRATLVAGLIEVLFFIRLSFISESRVWRYWLRLPMLRIPRLLSISTEDRFTIGEVAATVRPAIIRFTRDYVAEYFSDQSRLGYLLGGG